MVNGEWSGAEALENAFRVADEELRKVARERDEWRARTEAAEQYAQAVSDSNRDNADRASKAECERDAAVARAAQLEREVSKVEGRASAWSIKAQQWRERAEAAATRTAPAVTRDEVSQVVHGVLSTWYDNEDVVDAVCDLFGVGAGQAIDPVEELAGQIESATREAIRQVCVDLADVVPSLDPLTVEQAMEVTAASRKVAAHVIGQEETHVDQ